MAGGCLLVVIILWLLLGDHAATLRVNVEELTVSEVKHAEFKDYVRTNGQVLPIQVVQISPEEGGIVREKVVEEGTMVHQGDVIVRLSNSNLDLQILNAEAELAEKQNLLRNTQVAMQQDRLNNQPEQAILIPRGTFFQTTGGQWIFVLDKSGAKAYRHNIRIGRQNPQYYEVLEGLEPGEHVVTSGYEAFKDNEVLLISH